jgi:hypothetical protein
MKVQKVTISDFTNAQHNHSSAATGGTAVGGISWVAAPATKTSSGTAGQVAYDNNYFYICTATNIWERIPIATNW